MPKSSTGTIGACGWCRHETGKPTPFLDSLKRPSFRNASYRERGSEREKAGGARERGGERGEESRSESERGGGMLRERERAKDRECWLVSSTFSCI